MWWALELQLLLAVIFIDCVQELNMRRGITHRFLEQQFMVITVLFFCRKFVSAVKFYHGVWLTAEPQADIRGTENVFTINYIISLKVSQRNIKHGWSMVMEINKEDQYRMTEVCLLNWDIFLHPFSSLHQPYRSAQ